MRTLDAHYVSLILFMFGICIICFKKCEPFGFLQYQISLLFVWVHLFPPFILPTSCKGSTSSLEWDQFCWALQFPPQISRVDAVILVVTDEQLKFREMNYLFKGHINGKKQLGLQARYRSPWSLSLSSPPSRLLSVPPPSAWRDAPLSPAVTQSFLSPFLPFSTLREE